MTKSNTEDIALKATSYPTASGKDTENAQPKNLARSVIMEKFR